MPLFIKYFRFVDHELRREVLKVTMLLNFHHFTVLAKSKIDLLVELVVRIQMQFDLFITHVHVGEKKIQRSKYSELSNKHTGWNDCTGLLILPFF